MPSFFQPDPLLIAFAVIKEWVYLTLLLLFGLIRVPLLRRPALWAGLAGLVLTVIFSAGLWLPTFIGLSSGPLFVLGGYVGGMAVPIVCSGLFLVAAFLPGRRFWGLDALHGLLFLGLIGLWIYARIA